MPAKSSLSKLFDFLVDANPILFKQQPPRPGLVPKSGSYEHPYRWVLPHMPPSLHALPKVDVHRIKVQDAKTGEPFTAPVFHGSNKIFTTPRVSQSESGKGIFLTDNWTVAEEYGSNLYAADVTLNNPLVVDASGELWASLPMEQWIKEAKSKGHDGLVIQNIIDSKFSHVATGNDVIAFNSDAVRFVSRIQSGTLEEVPLVNDAVQKQEGLSGNVFTSADSGIFTPTAGGDRKRKEPYYSALADTSLKRLENWLEKQQKGKVGYHEHDGFPLHPVRVVHHQEYFAQKSKGVGGLGAREDANDEQFSAKVPIEVVRQNKDWWSNHDKLATQIQSWAKSDSFSLEDDSEIRRVVEESGGNIDDWYKLYGRDNGFTSSTNGVDAIRLRKTVGTLFNLPQNHEFGVNTTTWNNTEITSEDVKTVKAVYDLTQKVLGNRKIKVYRGVSGQAGKELEALLATSDAEDTIKIPANAISSFTLDEDTAESFATQGKTPLVLELEVDPKDVLAFGNLVGNNWPNTHEITVKSNQGFLVAKAKNFRPADRAKVARMFGNVKLTPNLTSKVVWGGGV